MVDLFDPRREPLRDEDILSFLRLINAPDQVMWDYEEPDADTAQHATENADQADAERIEQFRTGFLPNTNNFALWARAQGEVIGMVGINRFEEPSRAHCAELGIGVAAAYQRQGIALRLATRIVARAREVGLRRLEAECLADNLAVSVLLRKVGFQEEGMRVGAIEKHDRLSDIRLFGLLL